MDFLKNQIQSENKELGASFRERIKITLDLHGNAGLYRGFIAGSQCIFFRNGCAMIVMQEAQKQLKQRGYRD